MAICLQEKDFDFCQFKKNMVRTIVTGLNKRSFSAKEVDPKGDKFSDSSVNLAAQENTVSLLQPFY